MKWEDSEHAHTDELTGILREAVATIHNEPIDEGRASRICARAAISSSRRKKPRQWLRDGGLVGAAAAVLLLLASALAWNFLTGNRAWGEVIAAVRQKPWLRATATIPELADALHVPRDSEFVFWYSATHGVLATRGPGQAAFSDLSQKTIDMYVARDPRILRLPLTQADNDPTFRMMTALCRAFLAGDIERTLSFGEAKLVPEGSTIINNQIVEHRFALKEPHDDVQTTMVVRVDQVTKLPLSWQVDKLSPSDKKRSIVEYKIDYPAEGPASIYDLEVPKTAEILDRIPQGDLANVLDHIETERQNFDPYYAVVVHSDGNAPWWKAMLVERIWKKGNRWRFERSSGSFQKPDDPAPPPDVSPAKWWLEKADGMRFVPEEISDGQNVYQFSYKTKPNEAENRMEIVSVEKTARRIVNGQPNDFNSYPNLVGHPRIQYKSSNREVRLDLVNHAGPEGTILIEESPTLGDRNAHRPTTRFWISPEQSYLSLRVDTIPHAAGTANEHADINKLAPQEVAKFIDTIPRQAVLEAVDTSPQGHWYPTRVRDVNGAINPDGKPGDYVMSYYVDFDRPIPDDTFKAE